MNHDEGKYNEPNKFKPERWLTQERNIESFDQYKFPVFQGGPRIYIGKDLAILESKIFIAELVRRYCFKVVDKDLIKLHGDIKWKKNVPLVNNQ